MIGAAIVVNALSIVAAQPAMRGVVLDNVRTVDRVMVAGRWVDASKYREY
jgi:hypothetical protein